MTNLSESTWKEMTNYRLLNKWEPPVWKVYDLLMEKKYVDCFTKAGGRSDAPTCWASTRIDYIFGSPSFPLIPTDHFLNKDSGSDHALIAVEFSK
jgi:endonuclease/exonuclease/phosphatase family metal-dependent hydrolase